MKRQEQNFENLDATNKEILKILQQNAKTTVADIAKLVNLSTTPVHERIKKMEQEGIIKSYVALVDHTKINKSLMVICYVSLKEHNKKAGGIFVKQIQSMQEVVECYSISGSFDFMLKILVADMQTYYDFHVNILSQAENVGHIQSVFVMGVVKDTHVIL